MAPVIRRQKLGGALSRKYWAGGMIYTRTVKNECAPPEFKSNCEIEVDFK
jgi:hypothetical protein